MNRVYKRFAVTNKAIDDLTYEATINTAAKDRVGDIVIPQGARIEAFMQNPVVPFGHNYDEPPVAQALSVTVTDSSLVSRFKFPAAGIYPFADTIRQLWRDGFLNAMSIGFIPLKWIDHQGQTQMAKADDGGYFYGGTVTEWELLEHSIVVVPANQEALRRAVKDLHLSPDAITALTKSGRVISAANRKRIGDALSTIAGACSDITALLDESAPADDNQNDAATDDPDKTAPTPADGLLDGIGKMRLAIMEAFK
jgi:hypothetical protein